MHRRRSRLCGVMQPPTRPAKIKAFSLLSVSRAITSFPTFCLDMRRREEQRSAGGERQLNYGGAEDGYFRLRRGGEGGGYTHTHTFVSHNVIPWISLPAPRLFLLQLLYWGGVGGETHTHRRMNQSPGSIVAQPGLDFTDGCFTRVHGVSRGEKTTRGKTWPFDIFLYEKCRAPLVVRPRLPTSLEGGPSAAWVPSWAGTTTFSFALPFSFLYFSFFYLTVTFVYLSSLDFLVIFLLTDPVLYLCVYIKNGWKYRARATTTP